MAATQALTNRHAGPADAETLLDWNQPAIDFYRGLGATPLDAWTTFRLTDEALASLAGP